MPSVDPEVIAVAATLLSGSAIAVKILLDPSSPFLKRRHNESIRYSLLLGIPLGLMLQVLNGYSGYLILGLSLLLFSFTIYYYWLRRTTSTYYRFRLHWVSHEVVRSRFLHLAMTSSMAGFIALLLSLGVLAVPLRILSVPFAFQLSPEAAALLATVGSISALFALTLFVPKLDVLYCLLHDFVHSTYQPSEASFVEIEDTDFASIIAGTAFTPPEIIDAFETLHGEGYVTRQPQPVLGRVRYRLIPEGIAFLEASAQDIRGRIDTEVRRIEISLDTISTKVNGARALDSPALGEAVGELIILRRKMDRLKEEYGRLLPSNWHALVLKRVHDLEAGVREQRKEQKVFAKEGVKT